MSCVYKEYEGKTKMVRGAMTTTKYKVFIGLQHENCYLVGKKFRGAEYTGRDFSC